MRFLEQTTGAQAPPLVARESSISAGRSKNRAASFRRTPFAGRGSLGRSRKHSRDETIHRHLSDDHTEEAPIPADVDQTDAEASVPVKEQVLTLLMCPRRRLEAVSLPEHAHHPALSAMEPGIGHCGAIR